MSSPVLRRSHFTRTASGAVRHASWITPYGEVLLPVALVCDALGRVLLAASGLPMARKVGAKHVFVLPGGREVLR